MAICASRLCSAIDDNFLNGRPEDVKHGIPCNEIAGLTILGDAKL